MRKERDGERESERRQGSARASVCHHMILCYLHSLYHWHGWWKAGGCVFWASSCGSAGDVVWSSANLLKDHSYFGQGNTALGQLVVVVLWALPPVETWEQVGQHSGQAHVVCGTLKDPCLCRAQRTNDSGSSYRPILARVKWSVITTVDRSTTRAPPVWIRFWRICKYFSFCPLIRALKNSYCSMYTWRTLGVDSPESLW